ncbi:RHS repeat-associated core domain-containing protein [Lachnoclostridium phytofermentans]|uniref:RHS repeat-associated core domain-containing protein n=1 Tax=Lachnoclostridium phytofermentans TaxID=66219 RepID=UPI002E8DED77|nr:RHS repeat-associated core domain-containing protein [Lachnoclostridium phytofermentans]
MAATYSYDAFGSLLSKLGQANNTITYAGYQYDAETELYYLNARYYDSKIARFLTEDTYGGEYNDPLSLNRYTYCANNPIIYVDPSGRIWQKTDKGLNDDAQAKIIALTIAEIHAKTKEEKKELQKQQESIRNSSSSIKGVDTVIEINNKNQDAFIKYVNKALANGSISQTEWKKCLKSLGATYDFEKTYDKNKNGNTVSTINCTTNVNKNVEINVTANSAKNNKNTNIVSSSSNITVTTHYSAYVYYLPEWKSEMKDSKEALESYYGIDADDIGTVSVTSADEVSYSWNMMGKATDGNNISTIIMNTHGDHENLYSGIGDSLISMDFPNLKSLDVDNLILFGCNVGHLDYSTTNPAAYFSKIVNGGRVLASDGTVYSIGRRMLLWGDYLYKSLNDPSFYSQTTGTRHKNGNWIPKHKGWVIYQYSNNKVTTSDSLGITLSIKQMLKKMK